MPLVLHLETTDPALGEKAVRRIEVTSRLTIGRGSDNDLALADPQRHLSKNHCIVDFDGHSGTITDTSTNGVLLDGSPERLARNVPVPLQEGSVVRFGGYQLTVAAISPSHSASPTPASRPVGAHAAPGSAASDDALFGDPLAAAPVSHRQSPGGFPGAADELGGLDPPRDSGRFAPVIPDDIDLLLGNEPPPQWHAASQPDHTPADQVFFAPPRTTIGPIPEDWDNPEFPAPSTPRAGDRRLPADADFSRLALPEGAAPPVAAPLPPRAFVTPGAGDGMAVASFLAAVGLKGAPLSEPEKIRLMQLAGETFAAMTKGLCEILAARASTKQEFRIDRTVIGAKHNNPLKFSNSTDEAIRAMLLGRTRGFLPAKEAVAEALGDIQSHQLAVLAGMQVALATVIARFSPEKLEKRLEQGSLIEGILPAARKARYWELFKALYKEIATELEDDFQKAFGAEFARAYKAQVDRL
jgi:type VI secretion system protein